jgi:Swi5-dependent recombination DNA repair protein 1
MSTPQAKRRRLNEATNTLRKPFKSPFRTPLKPNIGSDPPSSDPPELQAPVATPIHNGNGAVTGNGEQQCATAIPSKQPLALAALPTKRVVEPVVSSSKSHTPSRVMPKKAALKPSVAREIIQLRNEIQMLTQAQTLATSTKDDDLVILIDRWRTASRAAAEELFGSTRDRVNRMGGVGAWQQRERESKERQQKWNQEEMEAEREKMEEAKENGEMPDEVYDRYAELSEDKVEEEKETFKSADDDVRHNKDVFN